MKYRGVYGTQQPQSLFGV